MAGLWPLTTSAASVWRGVRFSWILGLLLVLSPPAQAAPASFADLMGEAIAARKVGDWPKAAQALEAAYVLNPSPELHNNLGRVYEQLGRYIKAYDIYLAVSNDPLAERSLRALDASRMAALQPKIGVAWIVTRVTPEAAVLLLDGRLHEGPARAKEAATGPGRTGIELRLVDATEVTARVPKLPVGERSTLELDASSVDAKDAVLRFKNMLPVGEIRLDGHKIGTDLAVITTMRVTPGAHVLDIRRPGYKAEVHELDLHKGAEVMVSGLLKSVPLPQGAVAPWRPSKGPWVTGGVGSLAAAVGAGFLLSASASQAEIDAATSSGAVSGLSQARAQELNDLASSHGTLGNSLLATGLTALVGGAIWYFIDQSDAPDDSVYTPPEARDEGPPEKTTLNAPPPETLPAAEVSR
jgi:hypothetical protein